MAFFLTSQKILSSVIDYLHETMIWYVFENQSRHTYVVKPGSDSSTARWLYERMSCVTIYYCEDKSNFASLYRKWCHLHMSRQFPSWTQTLLTQLRFTPIFRSDFEIFWNCWLQLSVCFIMLSHHIFTKVKMTLMCLS